MTRSVFVCALAGLCSLSGFSQSGNWLDVVREARGMEQAGHFSEAAASLRNAIHRLERTSPQDPQLAELWNALASASIGRGMLADAEQEYRHAISLVEKTQGKASLDRALLLSNLAGLYAEEGRMNLALKAAREAAAANSPDEVLLTLANMLISNRNYEEAEIDLNLIREPHNLPAKYNDLGVIRMQRGRFHEAAPLFEQSIATLEENTGRDHALLLRPLLNLAAAYSNLKRTTDADAVYRRAMAILESKFTPEHPFYSETAAAYAGFLRKVGRKGKAKALDAKINSAYPNYARTNGLGLTIAPSELRGK